jgi:hypothetical protein
MDGSNLPHIHSSDDARAFAAAIAETRMEIVAVKAKHAPAIDEVSGLLDAARADRDAEVKPLAAREESMRAELVRWLRGDPDGQVRAPDGRVVATLAKAKPSLSVNFAELPAQYMQPNFAAIEAAVRQGAEVPGVTVTKNYTLKVT